MKSVDWGCVRRFLLADARGSVSAETVTLLGVAVLGMGSLGLLGAGMGEAIGGDGSAANAGAMHAPAMAMSRQAGVERWVADAAKAYAVENGTVGKLARGTLARNASRVESLVPAKVFPHRLRRALGERNLLSVTDDVWTALRGGEISPHEAFPALAGESSLWSSSRPDIREWPVDFAAPRKRGHAERPKPVGLVLFAPGTDGAFARRMKDLKVVGDGTDWLRFDAESMPEGAVERLVTVRMAIQDDKALADTLKRSHLRVAFADFAEMGGADMGNEAYVLTSDTLLVNANPAHLGTTEDVVNEVSMFVSEIGYTVESNARVKARPELEIRPKIAGAERSDLLSFFHESLRDSSDREAVVWSVTPHGKDGRRRFTRIAPDMAVELAKHDSRYAIPAQENLARFLKDNGFHTESRIIHAGEANPRVDLLHFSDVAEVEGVPELAGKLDLFDAAVDHQAARVYLNLDGDQSAWAKILADLVIELAQNP